jgi:hypothetical protein
LLHVRDQSTAAAIVFDDAILTTQFSALLRQIAETAATSVAS